MHHSRRHSWRLALATSALVVSAAAQPAAAETTISALFQAQAGYSEQDIRAMTDAYMKAHPDVKVTLEFVPYEALHDKAVLAKGSSQGYDVVLGDTIWTPEFAAHGILADVTDRITPAMKEGILPGALGSAAYKGHYYGLPWIADAKFLY
jgi:multiple sugar transport system substrate-binding protein